MPARRNDGRWRKRVAFLALAGILVSAGSGIPRFAAAHSTGAGSAGLAKAAVTVLDTSSFDFAPPDPGTYSLPPIKAAADGDILDGAGKRRRLFDLMDGRIVVLSFIYTRCTAPGGCPLATATLFDILDETVGDTTMAGGLRLISLSFDPLHDVPEVMAQYGAAAALRPEPKPPWDFVTCESDAALAPILKDYGQWVGRFADPSDPDAALPHVLRVYLIDRNKMVRNIYGVGFLDPRLVVADIRTLLLEQR